MIWVRHSGGPPFRGIIVIITLNLTLTLTLTLTPGSPEWRPSGMAELRNGGPSPLKDRKLTPGLAVLVAQWYSLCILPWHFTTPVRVRLPVCASIFVRFFQVFFQVFCKLRLGLVLALTLVLGKFSMRHKELSIVGKKISRS